VVANFFVLHLGGPERAVAEFARVTPPGGRLALIAWDEPQKARFLGVLGGSVRMAALIRHQTAVIQDRIRAEIERLVAQYRVADGLEIPVSARLAAGRTPRG
jgi:ubiquinone/menaquinone biosynthesis C-methylase UbiE